MYFSELLTEFYLFFELLLYVSTGQNLNQLKIIQGTSYPKCNIVVLRLFRR
jgi:hypothetical protein